MATPKLVACPRCSTQVHWSTSNAYRPFCSERCKLIDLGQWATEAYRVPQAQDPEPGDALPDPDG